MIFNIFTWHIWSLSTPDCTSFNFSLKPCACKNLQNMVLCLSSRFTTIKQTILVVYQSIAQYWVKVLPFDNYFLDLNGFLGVLIVIRTFVFRGIVLCFILLFIALVPPAPLLWGFEYHWFKPFYSNQSDSHLIVKRHS